MVPLFAARMVLNSFLTFTDVKPSYSIEIISTISSLTFVL